MLCFCFFFKQKSAYEMRSSDWSSDVCSSDLIGVFGAISVATACLLPASPAAKVASVPAGATKTLSVEHPTGALDVLITIDEGSDYPEIKQAAFLRTARKLFEGNVFLRECDGLFRVCGHERPLLLGREFYGSTDRISVVEEKCVSVRVVTDGRPSIITKHTQDTRKK